MDKNAIHRFSVAAASNIRYKHFGDDLIERLIKMFAPSVIGHNHIKLGLLLSAASCADDHAGNKVYKSRIRAHSFLIGEPGTAKSVLLREVVKIVPNSRYRSAQNSTGKSLTAIVAKEGGESAILRLGPIPFSKGAICALNELGRMSFDDQAPLLEVMEEGRFTFDKYGMSGDIRSPTVIIGSANPTTSEWRSDSANDGKIDLNDIPVILPLLDRFDYMFTIRISREKDVIREYAYAKSQF